MENCHSGELGSCFHASGILIEIEDFSSLWKHDSLIRGPIGQSQSSAPGCVRGVKDRMFSQDKKQRSGEENKLLAERRSGHDLLAGLCSIFFM